MSNVEQQYEDDKCCWTCGKAEPTHKEYRDALGKNEYTCDECHRTEYPEQYEEICDHPDCDRVLDINCPIMCYEDSDGEEMTLCNDCYMEGKYW